MDPVVAGNPVAFAHATKIAFVQDPENFMPALHEEIMRVMKRQVCAAMRKAIYAVVLSLDLEPNHAKEVMKVGVLEKPTWH